MKQFNDFDKAKESAQYKSMRLPAGGYVCKILGVKYLESEQPGYSDNIVIQFDITEGEHKDFFRKQYDQNTSEDKKWKGVTRIRVPMDDGSERDGWTKNSFARWIDSFEKSNPGYFWDWDEKKWKGKFVGITFGETGTVINGKDIIFTEARSSCSVDEVRDGSYYKQPFKARNGFKTGSAETPSSDGFMALPDGAEEELPF